MLIAMLSERLVAAARRGDESWRQVRGVLLDLVWNRAHEFPQILALAVRNYPGEILAQWRYGAR